MKPRYPRIRSSNNILDLQQNTKLQITHDFDAIAIESTVIKYIVATDIFRHKNRQSEMFNAKIKEVEKLTRLGRRQRLLHQLQHN